MTLLFILGLIIIAGLALKSIFKSFQRSERFFEYSKENSNTVQGIDYHLVIRK